MLQGINTQERVRFSSVLDKSEPKTVFVLRPLTGFEVFALEKLNDMKSEKMSVEYARELLKLSVLEIENYDFPEKDASVSEKLETLPFYSILEIAGQVKKLMVLTSEDEKN